MALKPGIGVPGQEYIRPKKKKKPPPRPKDLYPGGKLPTSGPAQTPFQNALGPKPKTKTIPEIGAKGPKQQKRQVATGIEKQLQDIIFPYFEKNKAFPSPDIVAQLSSTKPDPVPVSKEQWDDLWDATGITNADGSETAPDEFFNMKDGFVAGGLDRALGIAGKAGPVRYDPETEEHKPVQTDAATVKEHLKYQKDFKIRRGSQGQILNTGDAWDIVEFKIAIANRLKKLGVKVEFNPYDPRWEPEFEVAANRSVMGRQMAYLFWGSDKEEAQANKIVDTLRASTWGRDRLDEIASELPKLDKRVTGESVDWSNQTTVAGIVQAIESNPELEKELAYEGWIFGRALTQSESQARVEYANKWSPDRLPEEDRVLYEAGITGNIDALSHAMGKSKEIAAPAWDKVKNTRLGGAITAIGHATSDVTNTLNKPLEYLMRGMSTVGLMINYADTGMDWDQWVASLDKYNGEEGVKRNLEIKHDLAVLMDLGAWAAAWEDSETTGGPSQLLFESLSMSATGSKSAFAKDIGQTADLGLMIYVGAKALDPAFVGGIKLAGHGGITAARAVTPKMDILADAVKVPALSFPQFLARERATAGRTVTGDIAVFSKYHDPDAPVKAGPGTRKPSKKTQAVRDSVDAYRANPSQETFNAARDAIVANEKGKRAGIVHQKNADAKRDKPLRPAEIYDGLLREKDIEIDSLLRMEYSPLAPNLLGGASYSPEDAYADYLDKLPVADPDAKREVMGTAARWALLRTKSEHIAMMDDAYGIHRIYGLEDTPELKELAKKLAAEKDPKKIMRLVAEAEDIHGPILDGDSSAAIRFARAEAFRKGSFKDSALKHMWTPVHYGRSQQPVDASAMLYDVMAFTKLGAKKVTPEVKKQMDTLVRKMWEMDPDDRVGQQTIIDAFDRELERNLGAEQIAELSKFERKMRRARGLKAVEDGSGGVMYYAKKTPLGVVEGSKVVPARTRAILHAQVRDAKKAKDELAAQFPDRAEELAEAQRLATERLARFVDSMHDIKRYTDEDGNKRLFQPGEKDTLEDINAEIAKREEALRKAENIIDSEFASSQPFDPTQMRKHLVFKHDPRVVGWFMAGKPAQKGALADAWVIDPITRIWKETVMASMGFPIRVQIGDELIRLIPEGVLGGWRSARAEKAYMKTHDVHGNPVEKNSSNSMWEQDARGILADDTPGGMGGHAYQPEWGFKVKGDPGYFSALATHLKARRKSPIVQGLLRDLSKEDLKDRAKVKAYIKDLKDKKSKKGLALRKFYEDTYRVNPVKKTNEKSRFDSVGYNQWLDQYADYIESISANDVLLNAFVSGKISARSFKRASDPEISPAGPGGTPPGTKVEDNQWPPVETADAGLHAKQNPLAYASRLNPYHYVFHGLPVDRKVGGVPISSISTVGMLTGISQWSRSLLFSHYRYEIRKAAMVRQLAARGIKVDHKRGGPSEDDLIRARYEEIATPEMKAELGKYATDKAGKKAVAASYSQSRTVFEDMTKNIIPFGNAYRQFAVYWGRQFTKTPMAMSAVVEEYPDWLRESFHSFGDLGAYFKGFPFWAPSAQEDQGVIAANLPMVGPLWATGIKLAAEYTDTDITDWENKPMLGSLAPGMASFGRHGRLFHAITGGLWPADGYAEAILGDPHKMDQARVNTELAYLQYGKGNTTGDELGKTKPNWMKSIDMVNGWLDQVPVVGRVVELQEEALASEVLKTFVPFPATLFPSPEKIREREDIQYKFSVAYRDGNQAEMSRLRAEYDWLDKRQTYLEASPEEKAELRHDPAYQEELPFFVSVRDYDDYSRPIGAKDTVDVLYANGALNAKEADFKNAIHNIMTDMYGGTYKQTDKRPGNVYYEGDIAAKQAFDAKEKRIADAKKWAKGVLARNKTLSPDQKKFLWDGFVNSDEMNFGWWYAALKGNKDKNGNPKPLNPEEYRIDLIEYVYQQDHEEKMMNEAYPGPSTDELERAEQVAAMQPGPAGQKWLENGTGFDRLLKTRQDRRDAVMKELLYRGGDQWYYMGSEKMELLGVKYTEKERIRWEQTQLELRAAYDDFRKNNKAGTNEYKKARNAYWSLVKQKLRGQKGGNLLYGGLSDRLRGITVLTEPDVVSVGSGPSGPQEFEAWREYVMTEEREYAKAMPDMKAIDAAWKKVARPGAKSEEEMTVLQRRRMEVGRAAYWKYLLAAAKTAREDLRTSYSEYYKGQGNSIDSKYGKKKVAMVDRMIKAMAKDNPLFKADLEKYFDKDTNLAGRLLDWYSY